MSDSLPPYGWQHRKTGNVLHRLPERAQTHTSRVGDAIQPSHPLSPHSPPAFNLSPHQGLSSKSVPHIRWPKYWSFSFGISSSSEYPGLISFRMDWFGLLAVQEESKESFPTLQFKSINSSVLNILYGPTLIATHNYWKNHSFGYMDLGWQNDVSAF